jgi:dTDP-4-amino-4,6-dideoxygalactose transaminase
MTDIHPAVHPPSTVGQAAEKCQPPVYVTQPVMPPLDEFVAMLQGVWDNKILTNGGPMHQRLEAALAEHLGVPHISLFCNATIALVTALKALDLRGEVITTPYSFIATAHSLLWNQLQPVFVDIDPVTMNLDPGLIEAAITPRTTAIMPVHCYGYPCDTAAIAQIAGRHGLRVIYDAAHAFAVRDSGGSILRHGDLSVLSFHATKVFSTLEGGAIIASDAAAKRHIDHLKNFGITSETTVEATGINGRLQLRTIDRDLRLRRELDERYRQQLAGVVGITIPALPTEASSNHGYFPVLVDEDFPIDRDALYLRLREHGCHARRYFYPLITTFSMYRHLPSADPVRLPVATRISNRILCLPIYPALGTQQVDRICSVIAATAS